jgi:hypothetical protein
VEQHKKFILEGKGVDTSNLNQSTTGQISSITANQTVSFGSGPTNGFSVVVDSPNPPPDILRSPEATQEDARREERRRRQAELGTDDEADETMIKEKKRKVIKRVVEDDLQEEKKVASPVKKHQKQLSEVPNSEEAPVRSMQELISNPRERSVKETGGGKALRGEAEGALGEMAVVERKSRDGEREGHKGLAAGGKLVHKCLVHVRGVKLKEKPAAGAAGFGGPAEGSVSRPGKSQEPSMPLTADNSSHNNGGGGVMVAAREYEGPLGKAPALLGTYGSPQPSLLPDPANGLPKPKKTENLLIQPQVRFGQKSNLITKKSPEVTLSQNPIEKKPLVLNPQTQSLSGPKPLVLKKPVLASKEAQDDFILENPSSKVVSGVLDSYQQRQPVSQEWDL